MCLDLWGAGQETTSTTTNFGVLYIMCHPHAQTKLQEELDRVVGNDRKVGLKDRPNLPYTNAVCNVGFLLTEINPFSRKSNVYAISCRKTSSIGPPKTSTSTATKSKKERLSSHKFRVFFSIRRRFRTRNLSNRSVFSTRTANSNVWKSLFLSRSENDNVSARVWPETSCTCS